MVVYADCLLQSHTHRRDPSSACALRQRTLQAALVMNRLVDALLSPSLHLCPSQSSKASHRNPVALFLCSSWYWMRTDYRVRLRPHPLCTYLQVADVIQGPKPYRWANSFSISSYQLSVCLSTPLPPFTSPLVCCRSGPVCPTTATTLLASLYFRPRTRHYGWHGWTTTETSFVCYGMNMITLWCAGKSWMRWPSSSLMMSFPVPKIKDNCNQRALTTYSNPNAQ